MRPMPTHWPDLEEIIQVIPNALLVLDKEWRILAWNAFATELTGYPTDEVVGRFITELYPDIADDLPILWQQVAENGTQQGLEARFLHRDGHAQFIGFSASLLRDASAQPCGLIILAQDRTEQKRNQTFITALHMASRAVALARTPQQVFTAMTDELRRMSIWSMVFLLDQSAEHLILAHIYIESVLRDLADEVSSRHAIDLPSESLFIGLRFKTAQAPSFHKIQQTKRPLFFENYQIPASVSFPKPFEAIEGKVNALLNGQQAVLAPIWRDGAVIGQLIMGGTLRETDVAAIDAFANQLSAALANAALWQDMEDKVAQRTAILSEERERLHAILTHMVDAVVFANAQQEIEYVNPAWEALNGYTLAEVCGKTLDTVVGPETSLATLHKLRETITRGEVWQSELLNRRKDGSQYEASIIIVPVNEQEEEPRYYVAVGRDVTQEKMLARAQERFVSDISHELRTPLTNIKFYLSLLEKGNAERAAVYMETLQRETNRLHNLIEDLLALSRLDQGRVRFQFARLDLNAFLAALVADRQSVAAEKEMTMFFEPQPNLPPVYVDEALLEQAAANLLTNALHYSPTGTCICVSTAHQQDGMEEWVSFTVQDNGVGIPSNEQGRIFERFFRGHASRLFNTPGTGLGLSIIQEIVAHHGGEIEVHSTLGVGSAFTVRLRPHKNPV